MVAASSSLIRLRFTWASTPTSPHTKGRPFLVTSINDWIVRLSRHGVLTSTVSEILGFKRAYVEDPFDNRVEIMEAFGAGQ